ncbi:hypothetical protein IWW55_000287, partial [Coemansia sp. RSA 2706]
MEDIVEGEQLDRTSAFCDPNIVKEYLLNLVPVLLGDDEGDVCAMFADPEAAEKCRLF